MIMKACLKARLEVRQLVFFMHLKIVTEVCAHAHKCTGVMYMPVCAFGGQRVVLGIISLAPFCFGTGLSLTWFSVSRLDSLVR